MNYMILGYVLLYYEVVWFCIRTVFGLNDSSVLYGIIK